MTRLHATSFDPAWPEDDMRGHVDRDIVLGFGETLQGFIILRAAGDQAEILTLVTHPAHRKQGIGQTLITEARKRAIEQGVEIIFLDVAEDNPAAIALYRSCGFEQFGRRPAYYRRPSGRIAALTFRKKLDALATDR